MPGGATDFVELNTLVKSTRTFSVSIIGVFLLFGIPAAFLLWLGPFVAPNMMPILPNAGWSSVQFHSFVIGIGVGVGAAAAVVVSVVRHFLPPRLQSRIVWIPPEMFDRTRLKKEGLRLVAGLTVLMGMTLFIHYGPPRFWRDFEGMSEAEVRERLGVPFRDSRGHEGNDADEYTLGWYQGFEVGLFLNFKQDVVVSQERITR